MAKVRTCLWFAADAEQAIERYVSLIPDSRVVIFEDTGHMAMLERPQAFNSLLRDLLTE